MPWSGKDISYLRRNRTLGAAELSVRLGKTVPAVKGMALRLRISLRRPRSRRGLVLGQPRTVSLRGAVHGDIVSGRVDGELIAARIALTEEAETCPCCGRRPVEVRSTGFCLVCHRDRLIAAHLDEVEKLDSQRALWSSRQALCRARRTAQA